MKKYGSSGMRPPAMQESQMVIGAHLGPLEPKLDFIMKFT
jgi:hypothetical protein